MTSFGQISLALTLVLAAIGTYLGVTPPRPITDTTAVPPTGDLVRQFGLTGKIGTTLAPLPTILLTLHLALLALFHPNIPRRLLSPRRLASINPDLLTWSPATSIPLALILLFAAPLRLASYATLGRNFTFALAKPDHLVTSGIYAYVQHPSYTALATLIVANAALMWRLDSVLGCWLPGWMRGGASANGRLGGLSRWVFIPGWVAFSVYVVSKRVMQEEEMMRGAFGKDWEVWHEKTARFVPGVL
ncbi:hypothetical protein B0T16DRAFT_414246 [Cercophora newfieldiana]|uniref:Protein-S-isoprenylcysteine O-methyltransferase n=1 Tax=Cercophora newfieldiana TaxID=92897 RepID=A0AA39Y8D4_9PEZI|nr:hypothetical protein B0T16DRAFT_414246 [Cercophora newfieldiana]